MAETTPCTPISEPSPWVMRFASQVPAGAKVLDLACGSGRHTKIFLDRGHPVTALDRNISRLAIAPDTPGLTVLAGDLEDGSPWPLAGQKFGAVVVTNYLYRPLFPKIIASLAPGGLLIYETFALGNERFGKPRNPDHLLKPDELMDAFGEALRVIAYEDIERPSPKSARIQRICAMCPDR